MRVSPTLPPQFLESTIEHMEIGECGYTMPWAMRVDKRGHGYLQTGYPVYKVAGGTASLWVGRTDRGFIVLLPVSYRWTEEYTPLPTDPSYEPVLAMAYEGDMWDRWDDQEFQRLYVPLLQKG